MREREPRKETIETGDLLFLGHPGIENAFSGYGITVEQGRKDLLVGVLMVDRPKPADPEWLSRVEKAFGKYRFVRMTKTGERGILCYMLIEPESAQHLCEFSFEQSTAIKSAINPLLEHPPKPTFYMRWNEEMKLWQSQIAYPNELPEVIQEVFEKTGYGCLATEATLGVIHVCHASDKDIEGFANKPVICQWQLIKMPTAPLIRLELEILDRPDNPYKFESFLNIAEQDQANVLAQLANQDELYLAFYGDGLDYRCTKVMPHDKQQWQQIDELTMEARDYLYSIPPGNRDFDQAKAEFMRRFV